MNAARNHHFLSQFYLKGFTKNGSKHSKLVAVDLIDSKAFETTPRNVGAERDFNYIEGLPYDAVENSLARFEGTVAKSIGKIGAAGNLRDQDALIDVLNLLCLFAIRNPRLRDNVRQFQESVARQILDMSLATRERWESQVRQMIKAGVWDAPPIVPYEQLKKDNDDGGYRITVPRARLIQMEFKVFDSVLPHLVGRNWTLCIASTGSGGFITSDHPVCLMWSDGSPSTSNRPVGYGLTGTTVVFPLTSELLMVGIFDGAGGRRALTPLQVATFNGIVAHHVERQVYASNSQARVLLPGLDAPITFAVLPEYMKVQRRRTQKTKRR